MNEKIITAAQDFYQDEFAWCYGCGRLNQDGHHFRTSWQNDKTLTVYMPRPEHMAIRGFVYGGVIASMLDCHGSGSCALALHKKNGHELGDGHPMPRFVAASLKVNFLKPTPQDIMLKAIGIITEIHPKRFRINSELYAGEILCATSEFEGVVMPTTFVNTN